MPSFDYCMLSLGLHSKLPLADLKQTGLAYEAQGMAPDAALDRAVSEKLDLTVMEERRIVKALRTTYESAGGKKRQPQPVAAEKPPAPTPKVGPAEHIEGVEHEPASQSVIANSIGKSARNTPMNYKEAKAKLLADIDRAIAERKAGEPDDPKAYRAWEESKPPFVTFDVEGDGKFKVKNDAEKLAEFRKGVISSRGFDAPTKPSNRRDKNMGVTENQQATIMQMMEEGETVAAHSLAAVNGRPFRFTKNDKGGAPNVFLEAKPVDLPGGVKGYVGRMYGQKGKSWAVVEETTGNTIGSFSSSASTAEATARSAIQRLGDGKFQQLIADAKARGEVANEAELEQQWLDHAEKSDEAFAAKAEREAESAARGAARVREYNAERQRQEEAERAKSPVGQLQNAGFQVRGVNDNLTSGGSVSINLKDAPNSSQKWIEIHLYNREPRTYRAAIGSVRSAPNMTLGQIIDWAHNYYADALKAERPARTDRIGDQSKAANAAPEAPAAAAEDYHGFGDGLAPLLRARLQKALAKQFRFDGEVMTVKERVESLHKDGKLTISTEEEPRIKPMSRMQFHRADNREQAAHEKKMREAGTKTVYMVNSSDLGKTAYDYAAHLLKSGRAEEADNRRPWEMTLEEYTASELARNEYREQLQEDESAMAMFKDNMKRQWSSALNDRAKHGRIPDRVLDDMVARDGIAVVQSVFRGVNEPGAAGYLTPDLREPDAGSKVELYDIPDSKTVEINGQRRPIENSNGKLVAAHTGQQMAFWRWFGDSKVVDEQGRPVVVYHGTAGDFNEFDAKKASNASMHATAYLGHYFSESPEVANEFVPFREDQSTWPRTRGPKQGGNVMAAYVSIANPYRMPLSEFRDMVPRGRGKEGLAEAKQLRARLEAAGHDGIHVEGDPSLKDSMGGWEWAANTWIAFKPEQIKSATGNFGSFVPGDPNITHDVSESLMTDPRTALKPDVQARIEQMMAERAAGKMDTERFRQVVDEIAPLLVDRANEHNKRGPDWVRERLVSARRLGEMEPQAVEFALWALAKNPALANDLALEFSDDGNGTVGGYRLADRVMRLVRGEGNRGTAVHEILHHSERMMPPEVQKAIAKQWFDAYMAAWEKGDDKTKLALQDLLQMPVNPEARDRALAAFKDGVLNYAEHYQLSNASEYWAVNATRIMQARHAATSWVAKAKQWLAEFIERVKGWMGTKDTDAAVLNGLQAVLNGTGEYQSPTMLVQHPVSDISEKVTQSKAFKDWFGNSKVVARDGSPQVVYHGAPDARFVSGDGVFRSTRNRLGMTDDPTGAFWFASDKSVASTYADDRRAFDYQNAEPGIVAAYLKLENPMVVDAHGAHWREAQKRGKTSDVIEEAKAAGHDGVIIRNVRDEYSSLDKPGKGRTTDTYVVFRPEQIKSATGNVGTFDPSNPSILYDIAATVHSYAGRLGMSEAAANKVSDLFATEKTFNSWWHKTIGTQYHKAQIDTDFRKVYDATQRFLSSVSNFANEAADRAPTLLPKLDGFRDLGKKPPKKTDTAAAANAIFTGTLQDETVYSDADLRQKFNLTDAQIGMYREFRAAADKSLDDMGKTDILRYAGSGYESLRNTVLAAQSVGAASELLANAMTASGARDEADVVRQKGQRYERLKLEGYAPLMRFGEHTVYVTGTEGEQLFFGMYESGAEAAKAARDMQEIYPDATVTKGILSTEGSRLFSGISPDTIEVFANVTGMDRDPLFQDYLKLVVNNRSALKRLIHRKGVAGYSEDATRVLASFLTSNARAAAKNLHGGEMLAAAEAIPKVKGDVRDEAIKLVDYIQNPVEEAAKVRGLLFANFIGGSVASAAVNMTQPIMMTFPYLAQFGGAAQAGKRLLNAMRMAATGDKGRNDEELHTALQLAEHQGVVSPQEIHNLQAEAMRSSKGLSIGDKEIIPAFAARKLALVWGGLFGLAEQFNRRATFIAAYQTARDMDAAQLKAAGVDTPYDFAVKAIAETQGVYNRGNRPNWARGAVGATLMTFKQYSIAYMEFLQRLPKEQRALALAVLVVAAGANGLPFADDLDDVIDTIAQALGYNWNTKKERSRFVVNTLGQGAGDFVLHGVSGISGMPLDVSMRMGMQNLLPATGIFLKQNTDKSQQYSELLGAAGGLAQRAVKSGSALLAGNMGGAANAIAPTAIANLAKSVDMLQTGAYRDSAGRKVMDTDAADAAVKALGFQPAKVAAEQDKLGMARETIAVAKVTETQIADQWAQGVYEGDKDAPKKARDQIVEWNKKNPETPISITAAQIAKRLAEMRRTKADRVIKTAPKAIRSVVRNELTEG